MIQVSVSSIIGLGAKAETKVIAYVTSFARDLLKEAGRVEKDRRAPGVKKAEITQSDVSDANAVLRRVRRSRSRVTLKVAVGIGAVGAATAAGSLGTLLHSRGQDITFGIMVGLAVILLGVSIWMGINDGR